MKCLFAPGLLIVLTAMTMIGCGNTNTSGTTVSGAGILYVTTEGNTSVTAFGINLANGSLASSGTAVASGNKASAVVLTPDGKSAFVANSQDNTVSAYTVNSDGTLTASGSAMSLSGSLTPVALAIDPGGKFLFVADEGSSDVAVFSIQNTTLSRVSGSPFTTVVAGTTTPTGPVSLAVGPKSSYLYVANQFTNTVGAFSVGSNGALTALGPATYNVGIAPSALTLTPDGNFLYVANQGSNNVSAFAACTNASLSCTTPTGALTPVAGSPFSAGLGPIAIAAASSTQGEYLFVADYSSNQLSQFKVGVGSGVLTAQSPATLSTGTNPVSVAVRTGNGAVLGTGGTTNYVYVANLTSGTVSSFSYDTTSGALALVGQPLTTAGQPSALAVK